MLTGETATFLDDAGWSWRFDVTFMASSYKCVWGQGCHDTSDQHTDRGCCVEGVEIVVDAEDADGRADLEMLRGRVSQLTDEDWQNRALGMVPPAGRAANGMDPWAKQRFGPGSVHTRLYHDKCIFHNDASHPAGPGCAFHLAALRRGEDPIDWKPETCWRMPLFTDIDEPAKTTTVRAAQVVDWGDGDDADEKIISWWCTTDPVAYVSPVPLYQTMAAELRRIVSDEVYEELAAYMRARELGPQRPAPDRRDPVPLPMAP